jgi:hypothetical protein
MISLGGLNPQTKKLKKKVQTKEHIKNRLLLKIDKILQGKLNEEEVDDLKTVMSLVDNISSKNIRI